MIVAEIISEQTKTKVADVYIPQTPKEIKYSAFLEFSIKANNIFTWLQEEQEKETKHEIQYLLKVCDTVSSVLNVDPNILKNLKYNDQKWIWDAWQTIHNVIRDYTPSDNGGEFELNGKKLKVPTLVKSVIRDEVYLDSMTMQQVSEIGYIEKKLSDVLLTLAEKEKKELDYKKEDDEIQVHYSYALMKLAIVLSDPNDIPVDATFDRWLDERTLELADISMKDALDTIFFLIGLPKDYGVLIDFAIILRKFLSESYTKRIQQITAQE